MSNYPYVIVPEKLKKFLTHIQTAGIPPKIDYAYLKTAGFKSSNDKKIYGVLKFIGFIDNSGKPNEEYKEYRNTQKSRDVLGEAIKNSYTELFSMYPNADKQDNEALRNFFSTHSTAGERVLTAMVSTFRTLCAEASFEASTIPKTEKELPPSGKSVPVAKTFDTQSLTINIQLTLPETTNSTVYKEIFEAMRKYLIESNE